MCNLCGCLTLVQNIAFRYTYCVFFVTLAQTVLLIEQVLRQILTMGSVPFRGSATMVPGTDMSFEEYAEKARRHLEDPSQPDPRLLLTPGCSAHIHNGVRGPATEGGWRPAAKDHSWQLEAVVGSINGKEVTLRELQAAERRWKANGGPEPEVLQLSHASLSASKSMSLWWGTRVAYTAHH